MVNRPKIPLKTQRQILVEAGHRCAIQPCRNTANLDIHHIIPWEKCKEHDPENLIALCPNCHRLARDKKIDRKSLKKYKEICRKLAKPPDPHIVDAAIWAFIKFNPHTIVDILDSDNIIGITDNGVLDFSFAFDKPFENLNYVVNAVGSGSVTFKVSDKATTAIDIIFDEPCPDLVRLEFNY